MIAHSDNSKGKPIHLRLTYGQSSMITEQFNSKSGEIVFLGHYEIRGSTSSQDAQLII